MLKDGSEIFHSQERFQLIQHSIYRDCIHGEQEKYHHITELSQCNTLVLILQVIDFQNYHPLNYSKQLKIVGSLEKLSNYDQYKRKYN